MNVSRPTARTNSSREVTLNHTLRGQALRMRKVRALIKMQPMRRRILIPVRDKMAGAARTVINAGLLPNESVAALHSPASGYVAHDDRRAVDRHRGLPAAAGFSLAGSRLSNHSGHDVLPGRGSHRDVFIGDRAA